ncbi:cilia- and flagella-associated protein 157-like [Melanotaenia boesemani]|uniref:cilia- and flagella-associated protein 157-like n=1 Tax=Melanotaenia boesemani TaxID=1250792 RepID=UPI001C04B710|nr:cilia- and flagella-associated protein 157-like [Melanotaenia boesemani]
MDSKKKKPPTLVTKDPTKEKEKAVCLNVTERLRNELERYKQRSRELKREIEDMNAEFRAKEVDYKDIREYVEYKLAKLKKKKEKLREQLEKEKTETENVKAKTLLLRQEIQEQERRRDERKVEQASRVDKQKQELEQLNQLLSSKKTEVQEEMDRLKKQHEAALHKMEMEERMLIKRKQEEFDRLQEQKIAAIVQERAQYKEATDKADFLQRKMVRLIKGKRHFQSQVDELCPKLDKLKVTLDKHKQGLLNLQKEKEKLVKRCQRQKAKHEEMVRAKHEEMVRKAEALTQKQAECRSKLTDKSQLEARVQREKSRIKELEGDLKKAASMLTTIVSNPEMENKDQLMLKVLEILESPGPQEPGSADEISGGLKPEASGTEATAETENLEKKALFLMAQYRKGDLGLVPRPTWNPKPTGARHHTLRLPPAREPLWHKALDKFSKL